MRSDRMPEPTSPAVARAIRLFQPESSDAPARRWVGGAVEILARLVFDSLAQPAFAAARGVMSGRRLRFEAAGLELDLLAERRAGESHLTGQVASITGKVRPLTGARFLVLTGARMLEEGVTDSLGEFSVAVDRLDGVRLVVIDGDRAVTFPLPTNLDG
jgi:hypothetical protein